MTTQPETIRLPVASGCQTQDCGNDAIAIALAPVPHGPVWRITGRLACFDCLDDAVERWVIKPHVLVRLDELEPAALLQAEHAVGKHAMLPGRVSVRCPDCDAE